jgi:hypothetical protein
MLTLLTWPGRLLTRRADGALPAVVSLIVYLLVVGAVVLLVHARSAHQAAPAAPATSDQPANTAALTDLPTGAPAAPEAPPPVGPGGFVPLQSQAVKDAIHRALVSGATQRWQDGALSGYAVPSVTAGANGCRAIRYTIDQTPGAYGSITACDASAPR